jgi:hypothetical protein
MMVIFFPRRPRRVKAQKRLSWSEYWSMMRPVALPRTHRFPDAAEVDTAAGCGESRMFPDLIAVATKRLNHKGMVTIEI